MCMLILSLHLNIGNFNMRYLFIKMAQGRLAGKIAIITGSTYGIGFATARKFAAEDAKVIISSRKEENVVRATEELKREGFSDVKGVVCHVEDPMARSELLSAAEKWGGLNVLVHNAAVNPSKEGILDCSERVFEKIINVNLKSAFLFTKEAVPLLKQSPNGKIIFTSTTAIYYPIEMIGAYTVSKSAIVSLTKMVAQQLGKFNIAVNCISPGLISTGFSRILIENKEINESMLNEIMLKRFGTPEEVANVTAFLASDEASYITAENVSIAGGLAVRN